MNLWFSKLAEWMIERRKVEADREAEIRALARLNRIQ